MAEPKILVSTDIGSDIDDALAILSMINRKMPINGVYTVNGNVNARAYIAKYIAILSGGNMNVGIGSTYPINGPDPYTFFEDCYIDDSFIDEKESKFSRNLVYKKPEIAGINNNGLENMANSLSKERHTIFSLGPLTDIALLLEKYPQTESYIERLYIMGGRFSEGGQIEHNFRFDMGAAQKVLESQVPITIIPGDLCEKYRLPVKSLESLETNAGKYVQRMARGFLGIKTIFYAMHPAVNLGRTIGDILKALYISKTAMMLEPESRIKLFNKKEQLRSNLFDTYYAALEPDNFWTQYNGMINHLLESNEYFDNGKTIADFLENAKPKDISIADLYVPYCYQNRSHVKIQRSNVELSGDGSYFSLSPGKKLEIVTDIDIPHFSNYVHTSLK